MAIHISGQMDSALSDKVRSLRYLEERGLPIPPTIVVSGFGSRHQVTIANLANSEHYYVRLCFLDSTVKTRAGGIVGAVDVAAYARELLDIATDLPVDLLIQPMMTPTCSGGMLKIGDAVLIESVDGLAPKLFQRGKFSFRAVLLKNKVVFTQIADQPAACPKDISMATSPEGQPRFHQYHTGVPCLSLVELTRTLDNMILEWGFVDDKVVFFDYKSVPDSNCYAELRARTPSVPLSVTASIADVESSPLRRVLPLEYPDINYLSEARESDYVVIKRGALLSHLAVYSLWEQYKCVFS